MLKVSVIVPVYNVENYLIECLDSILQQSVDDMEIICVEDCSTDNSLQVLQQMSGKDERIKIICHSENKGLSAARNSGIAYARGKYILFVDSDDVLKENAICTLYETAEKYNTDVLYYDYMKFYGDMLQEKDDAKQDETINHLVNKMYSGKEFFCASISAKKSFVEVWRQFLRRDFLLNRNITFLDGILHEDNLFSFYVSMSAQRVYYIDDILYCYRQRQDSIMARKDEKRAQSMFVVLINIFTYWKTHTFTEKESICIRKYFQTMYDTYQVYLSYGKKNNVIGVGDIADKTLYELLYFHEEKQWIDTKRISLDMVRSYKRVIVFGAGHAARQVISYLEDHDISVDAVVVTDKKRNPEEFCGVRVYGIQESKNLIPEAVVIVGVTAKYADEAVSELMSAGMKNIITLPDSQDK